ncbi:MAG: hypothetical protein IK085_06160, partial [Clostridia bacterium]|nr:hypothetical protein [Clostridia bacterium]
MNTEKINVFTAKLKKFASTDAFCFILPFAVLSVWLITLILRGKVEKASGYYILHYLYTFDRGFISRGLPGEIISWFTDTVTPELTVKISTALSFMLVFSSALCIGYALKRTANNPEIRKMIVFFVFVLAILPVSFRTFLVDPKFDKVLWSLSLVSVVLSENRKTLVLIPFLCVIATLINPVFLFTSMFFISLVLLQRFYDSGYSKLNLTICIVSYA